MKFIGLFRSNVTPLPSSETTAVIAHSRTPEPVDRITYAMQQVHIQQVANQNQNQMANSVSQSQDLNLPLLRYQPHTMSYQAMPFHRTRGRNVRFCGKLRLEMVGLRTVL